MKVAVIGGGAAGFFAAISAKLHHPTAAVTIFEKSPNVLAKVKVSGGGRCNLTNGCTDLKELLKAYPRGSKFLKKCFPIFSTQHTFEWFEQRKVKLKTEPDGRVFPVTDRSQTVIDCLWAETDRLGISVKTKAWIKSLVPGEQGFALHLADEASAPLRFDKVIVATGGSPKLSGFDWLAGLGHKISSPIPSLFTFNMPKHPITQLMGLSVAQVMTSIQGTKLSAEGPLLVTHWGMSGPAILKLSAFGARTLSYHHYDFTVQINWANEKNQEKVTAQLQQSAQEHPNKLIGNTKPFALPERLWHFLLQKSEVPTDKKCGEIGKKGHNRLANTLTNDSYPVKGKTTFKEEFVTCGGVDLQEISAKTLESKICPNLFFAGEVMDIDAITGGYNFQAAWTTGFLAGKLGEG